MTTLATYRPRRVSVFDEMDRMMESMLGGTSASVKSARYPAVDVVEKENHFGLSVELPGYGKDDVEIKVDNNLLTISASEVKEAENDNKKEKESVRYIMHERSGRSFTRTFVLPKEVNKEKIEASFENGLLELVIPKAPKAEPKKISIKVK